MLMKSPAEQLIAALDSSDCDTLKALINESFPPDYTDDFGLNLLHAATASIGLEPTCDVLDVLLDAGVDINGVDDNGWPPIFFAVRSNFAAAVRHLAEHGAALDIVGKDQMSCLHLAAWNPFKADMVKTLVGYGARLCTENSKAFVRALPLDKRDLFETGDAT